MMTYEVTLSQYIEADSPEQATLIAAANADAYAYELGYRVVEQPDRRNSWFIDATDLAES